MESLPPSHPERARLINKAVNIGLICNLFLAALKIAVAIPGHSRALLADGINSCSDVAYYIVVKIFTTLAGKPADKEHPYGHQQMESIAAIIVGAFIITTAIAIFWDSVNTVYDIATKTSMEQPGMTLFTFATALFTVLLKSVLYMYTRIIAARTKNAAAMALTYDHRNDIIASIGAAIGIGLGWLNIPLGDPVAGAVVALVVLKTGIMIIRESSDDLMDTLPGEALERQITSLVTPVAGVLSIEEMTAHRFGPYLVINLVVGIDGNLSVKKGDAIATEIENCLYSNIELLRKVYVHYHPAK
ncbi:MAG: hypothetical protein A2283_04960 [Lentisphaerae bacterium RIFOXYA12_FULL_48_11]|nr:MAG: hypothetical protein A2283_04960 [Lentisphaerae bacterium RIFOXYA12_FULL_48_11]